MRLGVSLANAAWVVLALKVWRYLALPLVVVPGGVVVWDEGRSFLASFFKHCSW